MSTNAKWIIGLLIAIVLGLAAGLIIVAGDNADDETDTVTVPSVVRTEPTQPAQAETQEPAPETETDSGDQGAVGPGNGGLGNP